MTQIPFNCADQLTPTWLQRSEICADLLLPILPDKGQLIVADIGCGDQKLREILRKRAIPFKYFGYDLLPQTNEVKYLDVRYDVVPHRCDVAVMLGVTEYLDELSAILNRLAKQVPHLILSHVIKQDDTYSAAKLSELGWINHLRLQDLINLLESNGYAVSELKRTPDGRTVLVRCKSEQYGRVR